MDEQGRFTDEGYVRVASERCCLLYTSVRMTGDLVKAYPFLSDAEAQRFGTGKELSLIHILVLGGDFSDFVTRWHPMGR